MATPLIQYFEYSRDKALLNSTIYPFVRDNAEFYASWAFTNGTGDITFPHTCAQEACDCRDNLSWYWRWGKFVGIPLPNMTEETSKEGVWTTTAGEHDAHADIAFASASFRKAAQYSELLGVDADRRSVWQSLLARMPAYPSQTLTWVHNDSAIVVGADLSGKPLLVEAKAASTPARAAAAVAAGNSTIVWPWCNANYPITNFAAMWPTDEIGTLQTSDKGLMAAAKTTVYALNRYAGYTFAGSDTPFANTNGFGLSWPPTVRVSEAADSPLILADFARAATKVTAPNGIDANRGGMLENMGGVIAINDMLLQSHAGALRFFPVWDPQALGPASFVTLRGYGAFLASASIDRNGNVSPIEISSEQGETCFLVSPWANTGVVVKNASGAAVPVKTTAEGWYSFETIVGGVYVVSEGQAE
jgi:hypothetical protein